MSCYSPYHAFPSGEYNKRSGKEKYIITSNYKNEVITHDGTKLTKYIEVPCRSCLGCRLDYANEWTCRLLAEKSMYPSDRVWFLTFTYDDEHLPKCPVCVDYDCDLKMYVPDPVKDLPNLEYRDIQLFLKRVRIDMYRNYGISNVRFFVSGEYGPSTLRPHWHMIIFGLYLDPSKLKRYKQNHFGDWMYNHPYFDDKWNKGFVTVEESALGTLKYISRYTSKKMVKSEHTPLWLVRRYESQLLHDIEYNRDDYYEIMDDNLMSSIDELVTHLVNCKYDEIFMDNFDRLGARALCRPEFSEGSDGLGRDYYYMHKDEIYAHDFIYFENERFKVPRFYDRMLEKDDPALYQKVVADRRRRAQLKLDDWYRLHPGIDRRIWLEEQEQAFKDKMFRSKITSRDNVESEVII